MPRTRHVVLQQIPPRRPLPQTRRHRLLRRQHPLHRQSPPNHHQHRPHREDSLLFLYDVCFARSKVRLRTSPPVSIIYFGSENTYSSGTPLRCPAGIFAPALPLFTSSSLCENSCSMSPSNYISPWVNSSLAVCISRFFRNTD